MSDGQPLGYMEDVRRPVTCLVFLLPMVILYEIGMAFTASGFAADQANRVIAFQLLQRFSALFGASGYYMPGILITVILLAWHFATRDSWTVRWSTVGFMALESLFWAVPLVVLAHVASSYATRLAGSSDLAASWLGQLLLSVGAGIYEELLFRLILISILSIIFMDLLKIGEGPSIFTIVILSAILFSLYHHLGGEPFTADRFVFRTMAGGYLAGIFILRGFGIVVGCHVMYDIMAMALNTASGK